ncbi:inositol monophosphatase [bacterium]|nr:inositol monophosphatase [candidate division CSSED10-310 bacterium]
MIDSLGPEQLSSLCSAAQPIVREAGNLVTDYFNSPLAIEYKSRFDMVTEADKASERFIINALNQLTPGIPIIAEESSGELDGSVFPNSWVWVLDPLDGTTNFAHGFPHFAISLALLHSGHPRLGLVYDPLKEEMFTSVMNQGCFLNNVIVAVSGTRSLERSLIATGFPYRVRELKQNNLMEFCAFRLECQGIRRFGAAALDLAYVAAGRLDGFWERWLKPWDTAAGILMVDEAGGCVSRFDGSEYSVLDPDIVASNNLIHAMMRNVLNQPLPDLPQFPRLAT